MLPLVPTTMIVFLLSTSITATDTLLNGVAIAFVMEMDVRRPLLWILSQVVDHSREAWRVEGGDAALLAPLKEDARGEHACVRAHLSVPCLRLAEKKYSNKIKFG